MTISNAAPGKDVSAEDLVSKFPLAAKKSPDHVTRFSVRGVEFGGPLIPVMAGPNTVENEPMIVETAKAVRDAGGHILRGGAFKPLTFPYRSEKYFEPREQGLEWMAKARDASGLPIITEVMSTETIPAVAAVADILQIGTRNMQNYPLLTAVAKTGKPIMLKRGFGASLRDWLGAAEYILLEGNTQVILCERGVVAPHTHRGSSRFLLDLQVVPAAKEVTHLPVVTDPSHATFWRPWVQPMALASIGAGADGIMIEVHPDPSNAAVDPLQPVDYAEFASMMKAMDAVARAVGRKVLV
ncbi:3-deoxy-7-phosphoheptulonate synthase [Azospirillum sp.]|uniref:3-deoxy-7-phosphoheptulonate synthase n=1 Tax=Azospirillum sp. TaxID=34012 RepID=UPI002D27D0A1|nr:3-deoxy-7-phosphoheptulonate synthase [Azospirillum sp.]HYD63866.1 3-deoxy-7-phosphoheptulonate synthase [Azospirillum sp.]